MLDTSRFSSFSTTLSSGVPCWNTKWATCFSSRKREGNYVWRHICCNAEEGNSTHVFVRTNPTGIEGTPGVFQSPSRATTWPALLACGQRGTETPCSALKVSGRLPAPGMSLNNELDCLFHLSKLRVRNISQSESLYWLKA